MSVAGLCEICERPNADRGCDRCGRLVCDRHWDEDTGMCADCAVEVGKDRHVRPDNLPDGVDTYEF